MQPMIAVFDRKTQLFDSPFTCRHAGQAIRDFETLKADSNTKFGKHPEDYELYQIGSFNDENGHISKLEQFVQLG